MRGAQLAWEVTWVGVGAGPSSQPLSHPHASSTPCRNLGVGTLCGETLGVQRVGRTQALLQRTFGFETEWTTPYDQLV